MVSISNRAQNVKINTSRFLPGTYTASTMTTKSKPEQQAEERFRRYKKLLVSVFGRGPLIGEQIDAFGRAAFEGEWRGVGGQNDFIPSLRPGYYVVNTSYTANSPGVHWTALYVTKAGKHHVYDSFARRGATILANLKGRGSATFQDSDRSDAEQRGDSAVCGHLSIAWLMVVRDLGIKKAKLI